MEVGGLFDVLSFGVAAGMDETIHVNVEVVDVGVSTVEGFGLALYGITQNFGVAHAHPFEEYGDTHPTIDENILCQFIRVHLIMQMGKIKEDYIIDGDKGVFGAFQFHMWMCVHVSMSQMDLHVRISPIFIFG